jgi:hypothetical protein
MEISLMLAVEVISTDQVEARFYVFDVDEFNNGCWILILLFQEDRIPYLLDVMQRELCRKCSWLNRYSPVNMMISPTWLTVNVRLLATGMKISRVGMPSSSNPRLLLFFAEKYDIVGRLLKPGEKPSVYPPEESTPDAVEAAGMKKTE